MGVLSPYEEKVPAEADCSFRKMEIPRAIRYFNRRRKAVDRAKGKGGRCGTYLSPKKKKKNQSSIIQELHRGGKEKRLTREEESGKALKRGD